LQIQRIRFGLPRVEFRANSKEPLIKSTF
jgi:hypothetical protein